MTDRGFARCMPLALCAFLVVLGGSGCATTAMKGTPFFSGEYAKRLGPPEERVNLWPLLYYREPALSVLWPLIDYTDDYFAFRPVFSVYGLDRDRREYNVLWPWMHFEKGDNWILPFFWGKGLLWGNDDYCVGFPLYWHVGHPLSAKGGFNSLFPLWCYRTESDGYDLNLLWPVMEFKSQGKDPVRKEGWRVWPLFGSYRNRDDHYCFAGWPLAQFWWNDKREDATQCVLPLWYYERDRNHSLFASLLFSREHDASGRSWWLVPPLAYADEDRGSSHLMLTPLYWQGRDKRRDSAWDLLVPLYYRDRDPNGFTFATLLGGGRSRGDDAWWFFAPALSGGRRDAQSRSTWWLGGLGYRGKTAAREAWHALPFCYSVTEPNRRMFLSLPWSGGESDGGSSWSLAPPVWFHTRDKAGELTLLFPYVSGSETGGEHDDWWALLPFCYRRTSDRGSATVTPLIGWETDKEKGQWWMLYVLLTGGRFDDDSGSFWFVGPLFHAAWDQEYSTHHLLPAYYWNGRSRTLLSAVYSKWKTDDASYGIVPPALTFWSSRPGRSDLWSAAGLVHWSWGKEAGSRHVLPVYIGDSGDGWHATPAIAWWRRGTGGAGYAAPLLLSWYMSDPDRSDAWVAGPLMHFSWGEQRGGSHVFPVAYWNTRTSTYAWPGWVSWRPGPGVHNVVIPPVLGAYERNHAAHDLWLALGLFHHGGVDEEDGSAKGHLIPLYMYERRSFLTPLFGWNNGDGVDFWYFPTPLLGFWRNERTGMWLFPLFSWCRDPERDAVDGNVLWGLYHRERDDTRFSFFPLFSYHRWDPPGTNAVLGKWQSEGCDIDYLLMFGRYLSRHSNVYRYVRREGGKEVSVPADYREHVNRLFPVWRYSEVSWEDGQEETRDFKLLLFLYDHRTENQKNPQKGQPSRYVRSRVLYHLWHYERMDESVSVDVFPAITYDRRGDSLRKFSFLWRGFRYERKGDQRAVDLLFFIPLWRTSWVGGDGGGVKSK